VTVWVVVVVVVVPLVVVVLSVIETYSRSLAADRHGTDAVDRSADRRRTQARACGGGEPLDRGAARGRRSAAGGGRYHHVDRAGGSADRANLSGDRFFQAVAGVATGPIAIKSDTVPPAVLLAVESYSRT